MIGKKYIVSGKVQGVGFRYYTENIARKLNLMGYVKNLRNQNVECLAYGSISNIKIFEKELKKGPALSKVDNLQIINLEETETKEILNMKPFRIQY